MCRPLTIFVSHPSDFITDHRAHGDGRVAHQLIQRLAERGHHLHVAYTSADLAQPLHGNVTLHQIVSRIPSVSTERLEYMVRVRRLFQRLQTSARPCDLIHQFHPVFEGRSGLLTNVGVPLVIGVFQPAWPLDAEKVSKKVPFTSRLASVLSPLVRAADRRQQRQAAALLLSTPAAASRLYQPEDRRARQFLLWCPGVETADYAPTRSTAASRPAHILFLGNLERRKGIFVLAEAFRTIWRERPDARLVFVGDGSQRATLESYVRADESKVAVEFRGELHGDKKKNALLAADLVVIPSLGEPYGIVALEAMACARPIVATRAGGLQHLVPPEGGRLIPPGSAPALARAVLELLGRSEQLAGMGQFNRKLAVERFDWERVIERLEQVYYSVLPGCHDR